MSAESKPKDVYEWVKGEVAHRTEPAPDGKQDVSSNVWTAKRRLNEDGRKFSVHYSPEEIAGGADSLVADGELFGWHGLLAPMTKRSIRAIIENERKATITRSVLVGKANAALQEVG